MAFPDTLDSDFGTLIDSTDYPQAAHVNTLRRAVEGLEDKMGIDGSTEYYSMDYKVNKFFVPATKLYFYANSPPTGWTTDSVTDKVLAVKGGSASYNVNGGNTAGSFTILSANMPSHRHSYGFTGYGYERQAPGKPVLGGNTIYGSFSDYTDYTGGSDGLYRPYAAVGIIAYNGNFLEYHDS